MNCTEKRILSPAIRGKLQSLPVQRTTSRTSKYNETNNEVLITIIDVHVCVTDTCRNAKQLIEQTRFIVECLVYSSEK